MDIPGTTKKDRKWQSSGDPHIGITAPPPNQEVHLTLNGVAVPDGSASAHIPIAEDWILTTRRRGDMQTLAEIIAAKGRK